MDPQLSMEELQVALDEAFDEALRIALRLHREGQLARAWLLAVSSEVAIELAGEYTEERRRFFAVRAAEMPMPTPKAKSIGLVPQEEEDASTKVGCYACGIVWLKRGEDAATKLWWDIFGGSTPPWRMSLAEQRALHAERRSH